MEQHGRNLFSRVDSEHPDYEEWLRMRNEMVAGLPTLDYSRFAPPVRADFDVADPALPAAANATENTSLASGASRLKTPPPMSSSGRGDPAAAPTSSYLSEMWPVSRVSTGGPPPSSTMVSSNCCVETSAQTSTWIGAIFCPSAIS